MADSFDSDLNDYLRDMDAKSERQWDLAEEISELYSVIPNDYAELYKNGKHVNTFTHQEAIQYILENDDEDNWTIEEVEE
jgi:hypothetical protein